MTDAQGLNLCLSFACFSCLRTVIADMPLGVRPLLFYPRTPLLLHLIVRCYKNIVLVYYYIIGLVCYSLTTDYITEVLTYLLSILV